MTNFSLPAVMIVEGTDLLATFRQNLRNHEEILRSENFREILTQIFMTLLNHAPAMHLFDLPEFDRLIGIAHWSEQQREQVQREVQTLASHFYQRLRALGAIDDAKCIPYALSQLLGDDLVLEYIPF